MIPNRTSFRSRSLSTFAVSPGVSFVSAPGRVIPWESLSRTKTVHLHPRMSSVMREISCLSEETFFCRDFTDAYRKVRYSPQGAVSRLC